LEKRNGSLHPVSPELIAGYISQVTERFLVEKTFRYFSLLLKGYQGPEGRELALIMSHIKKIWNFEDFQELARLMSLENDPFVQELLVQTDQEPFHFEFTKSIHKLRNLRQDFSSKLQHCGRISSLARDFEESLNQNLFASFCFAAEGVLLVDALNQRFPEYSLLNLGSGLRVPFSDANLAILISRNELSDIEFEMIQSFSSLLAFQVYFFFFLSFLLFFFLFFFFFPSIVSIFDFFSSPFFSPSIFMEKIALLGETGEEGHILPPIRKALAARSYKETGNCEAVPIIFLEDLIHLFNYVGTENETGSVFTFFASRVHGSQALFDSFQNQAYILLKDENFLPKLLEAGNQMIVTKSLHLMNKIDGLDISFLLSSFLLKLEHLFSSD